MSCSVRRLLSSLPPPTAQTYPVRQKRRDFDHNESSVGSIKPWNTPSAKVASGDCWTRLSRGLEIRVGKNWTQYAERWSRLCARVEGLPSPAQICLFPLRRCYAGDTLFVLHPGLYFRADIRTLLLHRGLFSELEVSPLRPVIFQSRISQEFVRRKMFLLWPVKMGCLGKR